MSETTEKTRIQKVTEMEAVKYEIYISRTDRTPVLFYLEESDFLSLLDAMKEVKPNE
ncbi:hypothetical protein [Leptospira alstonii]|uniref:Uncharacterized protein n=2 Tax=Leptospira alstonii TaxID=28452 RepID=M6CY03_9LEPT|nr:hypothetical protein [Leptospira alstonii]EMJ96767.1 hypothetical protein LEP1GSC194_4297 [Leptospira alstonii serovar Sichuan str. 79601]EQA78845.1 hypothetical protein LEP1GSC193_1683 [Leptospira alstonii serovar Pingchang str. 80-412]